MNALWPLSSQFVRNQLRAFHLRGAYNSCNLILAWMLTSLITSKTFDRTQHRRDQEELMRNLYTDFKGDIYIEDAIKATRVAINTAAD